MLRGAPRGHEGFRRKPESSYFKMFWTPAFAGVTPQKTFYETIKIPNSKRFGLVHWILEFRIYLEFGAWDLEFIL
jgi:hypothetical protein